MKGTPSPLTSEKENKRAERFLHKKKGSRKGPSFAVKFFYFFEMQTSRNSPQMP
jgi:hypothetical protein